MDFASASFVNAQNPQSTFPSQGEAGQGCLASGYLKQGRSSSVNDDWRVLKAAKNDAFLAQCPPRISCHSMCEDQEQLLSFSMPPNKVSAVADRVLSERNGQSEGISNYQGSFFSGKTADADLGGWRGGTAGFQARTGGPFNPSQWVELEHQLLIYKYLRANLPVPSTLLAAIKKSLFTRGASSFQPGAPRPAWGSLYVGCAGTADPEPGRCRRTDGKKWRCSRDAVADQKYCERHMNRGRHRSRKPVEGHTGHATSRPTAAALQSLPISSSAPVAGSVSGTSNSLIVASYEHMHAGFGSSSMVNAGRSAMDATMLEGREQSLQSAYLKNGPVAPEEDSLDRSAKTELQLPSFNFPASPTKSSYLEGEISKTSDKESDLTSFHNFITNWPRKESDCDTLSWLQVDENHSDNTKLSISVPSTSMEFSSSMSKGSSSFKPSSKHDGIPLVLGVGGMMNGSTQMQQGWWRHVSWESSLCGPLGEALKNANRSTELGASAVVLEMEEWDAGPQTESSPTGVLQLPSLASRSNSSTGSSPRAEIRAFDVNNEGCNELLCTTYINSSSLSL